MSKTENNLLEAFSGESQTNRRYLAFAQRAEADGFKQVGKLFRAAAEAEAIHAFNHLLALGGIKSTRENLEAAIRAETNAFENRYPQMIKDAKAENNELALRSFTFANETEKGHSLLYEKALETLGNNPETDYYVCTVCGHTVEEEPPDECPICRAMKKMYKKID